MLLFIDESGHDHKAAPYEVLAGVAIRERDLWNLIQANRNAELEFLGLPHGRRRSRDEGQEIAQEKDYSFRWRRNGD